MDHNIRVLLVEDESVLAMVIRETLTPMGFDITIHADQFTTDGSDVAIKIGAVSADHLEASKDVEIKLLAN